MSGGAGTAASPAGLLSPLKRDRMTWVLCGAIWVGVVLAHYFYMSSVGSIMEDNDSGVFYEHSVQSLTSEEFWKGSPDEAAHPKPPTLRLQGVVLFWKFFSSYASFENRFPHEETGKILIDDTRLLWAHTLLCIVAWTSLALACVRMAYNSRMRPILFACPLVISLVPEVIMWNFVARSESFSLSMFVMFVAFWILFLRSRHVIYLVAIAIVAMFWAGARETNAYGLAMISIVLLGVIIYRRGILRCHLSKSVLPLIIWFIAMFAVANTLMDMGDRWKFPFFNVMGQRILNVSDHVEYFKNYGMPINEALREREGKWASDDAWAFFTNPDLEEFRVWSNLHGKATYMKFLISHPVYSITTPLSRYFKDLKRLGKKWYGGYTHPELRSLITFRIPASIIHVFPPIQYTGIFLVLLGAAIFRLAVRRYGWAFCCSRAAVPVTMILLSIPHYWLTYHGDAMEIHRHGFLAVFQLHLGFVLLGLFAWDMMLGRNGADHGESHGETSGSSKLPGEAPSAPVGR